MVVPGKKDQIRFFPFSWKAQLLVFFCQLIWLVQFNQFTSVKEFIHQWEINIIPATTLHTFYGPSRVRLEEVNKTLHSWYSVAGANIEVVTTSQNCYTNLNKYWIDLLCNKKDLALNWRILIYIFNIWDWNRIISFTQIFHNQK